MLKKYLTIFLISMVPILELRGAIPYSVGFGLPSIPSFIVCVIGNMIPVPFIYWFARRVLEWGKDKRMPVRRLLPHMPILARAFSGQVGSRKLRTS